MNDFFKSILKKASIIAAPVIGTPVKPKIGNASITTNNACETVYEGSYRIPEETTATITGTMLNGFTGGGTAPNTIIGTITKTEGVYPYSIDLGNSNTPGQGSSYRLDITLSNGESASKLLVRTSFNSIFYDKAPC